MTFDDGPQPGNTEQILAILAQNSVKATFFQIGEHLSAYPDLGRSVRNAGHAIGNHTWSHQETPPDPVAEVDQADATIQAVYGGPTGLFRPPFGNFDNGVVHAALQENKAVIVWSVDPKDWDMPGTSAIVNTVVSGATPGGIVLMHDGGGDRTQTIAALPLIISQLRAKGYRFVTVPELLALGSSQTTDPTPPAGGDAPPLTLTIFTPGDEYSYHTLTATGTVGDNGQGIASVTATLKRFSDGLYWDGVSGWSTTVTQLPTQVSGTSWTLPLTTLADGHYTFDITGTDKSANITSLPWRDFWIDNVAPSTTIVTPQTGTIYATLAAGSGTSVDVGAGLSGVTTAVMRSKDGFWWTGSTWSASYTEVNATVSGSNWSLPLPTLSDGAYIFWARGRDFLGNVGLWARSDFTIASTSTVAAKSGAISASNSSLKSF